MIESLESEVLNANLKIEKLETEKSTLEALIKPPEAFKEKGC